MLDVVDVWAKLWKLYGGGFVHGDTVKLKQVRGFTGEANCVFLVCLEISVSS